MVNGYLFRARKNTNFSTLPGPSAYITRKMYLDVKFSTCPASHLTLQDDRTSGIVLQYRKQLEMCQYLATDVIVDRLTD